MNPTDFVQYGLTGFPLGHSFSKAFFTDKFREEGLRAEYLNFPLEHLSRAAITAILKEHPALKGLNVTAPHKRTAFELADTHTPEALAAGAANTLRFRWTADSPESLLIEAHNTDIEGFREAIRPYLRPDISKALICGTGGAADAVRIALSQLGIEARFVSRTPEAHPNAIAYAGINRQTLKEYPLIVNATPLGTFPRTDACVDLPYSLLGPENICADLVYNPAETLFMSNSRSYGARVLNGYEMLRLQALASYKFWNE